MDWDLGKWHRRISACHGMSSGMTPSGSHFPHRPKPVPPEETHMIQALAAAPAVVRASSLRNSISVEPLTCTIGAELGNVNLGAAAEDDQLMAEIRALLLKHRVVFFRDQDITRAQHVAFAR